jgi:adenine-specific DNA-methyltransferase
MNYIGSKQRLSQWIKEVVKQTYGNDLSEVIFADIFAGTGQVARNFKSEVKKVITNDLESYSFALNSHYIGNTQKMDNPNFSFEPIKGSIYTNFTEACSIPRKYFTEENAMIIDGIRQSIENHLSEGKINQGEYNWLLASLIESADSVANTASVYGAFLKAFKKTALKKVDFKLYPYEITNQKNEIYQMDANDLVKQIKGNILYLDPPYNNRQYGANYHVLNRIVENKEFSSEKLTGLLDYNKSEYCRPARVAEVFEQLIADADFEFIYISYNNEGLIKEEEFKNILKKYGHYELFLKEYKRFKADSKRPNQQANTFEHLHVLKKL